MDFVIRITNGEERKETTKDPFFLFNPRIHHSEGQEIKKMSGRVGVHSRGKSNAPLLPHGSLKSTPTRKGNYKYHILLLLAALAIFGAAVVVIVLPPGYTLPPKPHIDKTVEEIELASNMTCQTRSECFASDRLIDFASCTTCVENACVTSVSCPENWYCGFFYSEMCVERDRMTCSVEEDCNAHFGGGNQYCSRCVEGQCVATKKCRTSEICTSDFRCIRDPSLPITQPIASVAPVSNTVESPAATVQQPVSVVVPEQAPISPPFDGDQILTIDELGRRCQLTKVNATTLHPVDVESLQKISSWIENPPVSWRVVNTSEACGKWFGVVCEPCCNYTNYLCVKKLDISGYTTLRTKKDANVTLEGFLNLRYIDLSNNPLGPAWPRRFPWTTIRLRMNNCNFSGPISDEFKSLPYLREIDVSGNNGTGVFNVTESLPNTVVSMNISSNSFEAITGVPSGSMITHVDASHNLLNNIYSIPNAIKVLNVSDNQLSELPSQLSQAYALEEVDFSSNWIIKCPEVISAASQPILESCNSDVNPMHCVGEPSVTICRQALHPVCVTERYGSNQNCYKP